MPLRPRPRAPLLAVECAFHLQPALHNRGQCAANQRRAAWRRGATRNGYPLQRQAVAHPHRPSRACAPACGCTWSLLAGTLPHREQCESHASCCTARRCGRRERTAARYNAGQWHTCWPQGSCAPSAGSSADGCSGAGSSTAGESPRQALPGRLIGRRLLGHRPLDLGQSDLGRLDIQLGASSESRETNSR